MKDPPSTCLGGSLPGNNLIINRHEVLHGQGERNDLCCWCKCMVCCDDEG